MVESLRDRAQGKSLVASSRGWFRREFIAEAGDGSRMNRGL